MYYVYYLKSSNKDKFHYIGCTSNIKSRLVRHNTGRVKATKRFIPLKLLGYRTFETKTEAFQFEKAIKKSYTLKQDFINKIISNAG